MPDAIAGLNAVGGLFDSRFGTWVATLVSALVAGGFGIWYGNRVGLGRARKERLREIYSGIMETAIRLTPKSLQRRAPIDGVEDGEEPRPSAEEIDKITARLMVEPDADEDEVLKGFLGVYNFSTIYRVDRNNKSHGMDVPDEQLRKDRAKIERSLKSLQAAIRARLR